jgi:hypothetical protein
MGQMPCIIAGRVESLENRVSNMERLLMKPRKQNQNDVAKWREA